VEVVSGRGLMSISKLEPSAGDTLFFTEENNLLRFYGSKEFHFHPKNIDRNLIDDKLYFSKSMVAIEEKPVPFWEIVAGHNQRPPELPIYIKARHSWKENRKLPQGYICHSEEERLKSFELINANGWSVTTFFYQKLLNSPLQNNISVSGFFDHQNTKRNILLITRKLIGYKDKMAMGMMVITNPDPERLIERANNILQYLQYTGPFELEFFYEEEDHTYYVLELNPRFWMQHGIFVSFFGNGLITRYLGMDTERDWNNVPQYDRPLVWIDNLTFLLWLLRFRTSILRILLSKIRKGGRPCFYPSFSVSFRYTMNRIFTKIKEYFPTLTTGRK
jgi:hypothetical protein